MIKDINSLLSRKFSTKIYAHLQIFEGHPVDVIKERPINYINSNNEEIKFEHQEDSESLSIKKTNRLN